MSREITNQEVDELYGRLKADAESGGYFLNPDVEFTKELVRGLARNELRYGYQACPCRLAEGEREKDLDIICPCDYRDPDLDQYDTCYCALYVSEAAAGGEKEIGSIPERRLPPEEREKAKERRAAASASGGAAKLAWPVWRCQVCGYLAARDNPPGVCPVCKVKKDRFERFM